MSQGASIIIVFPHFYWLYYLCGLILKNAELQETFLLSISSSPVYFVALRAPLIEKQNSTLYKTVILFSEYRCSQLVRLEITIFMCSGFNDAAKLRENNFKLRHKGSCSILIWQRK